MTGKNDIWKKRFKTNVLPYLQTVCMVGALDDYQFMREYKCDYCYEYFLTDFSKDFHTISKDGICEVCEQYESTYLVEMDIFEFEYFFTHGSPHGPGKCVKISRATKFEDIKKIIKKISYIEDSNFKLELKQTCEKFKL
jgi:hypothetical protein